MNHEIGRNNTEPSTRNREVQRSAMRRRENIVVITERSKEAPKTDIKERSSNTEKESNRIAENTETEAAGITGMTEMGREGRRRGRGTVTIGLSVRRGKRGGERCRPEAEAE